MSTRTGNALRWTSTLCLLAGVVLVCTACSLRTPTGSHGTPAEHGLGVALLSIGEWCIFIGTCTVIACALVRIAGFFPATSAFVLVISPFIGEAAALGAATAIIGGMLVWFGVHSWVLYATFLVLAGGYIYRHRETMRIWFGASAPVAPAP